MNKNECVVGFSLVFKLPVLFLFIWISSYDLNKFFEGKFDFGPDDKIIYSGLIFTLMFLYSFKIILKPRGWHVALGLGKKRINLPFNRWASSVIYLGSNTPAYGIHLKSGPTPQLAWGLTSNYKKSALYLLEHGNKHVMDQPLIDYLEKIKAKYDFKKGRTNNKNFTL